MAEVLKTNNMKKESAFKLRSGNKPSIAKLTGVKKSPAKIELGRRGKAIKDKVTKTVKKIGDALSIKKANEKIKEKEKQRKLEFRKYVKASNKDPKKYPPISSEKFTSKNFIKD